MNRMKSVSPLRRFVQDYNRNAAASGKNAIFVAYSHYTFHLSQQMYSHLCKKVITINFISKHNARIVYKYTINDSL